MVHNIIALYAPSWQCKNYSRSYEFRQIICPLNKHHQNKQNFGKVFKIQVVQVDINNNGVSCNCYVILTHFYGIKSNNSFRLQHFVDKHMVFGCKSIEH